MLGLLTLGRSYTCTGYATLARTVPLRAAPLRASEAPFERPAILAKVPAALCVGQRPLREGEVPKRSGQTWIFEASGGLNPELDPSQLSSAKVTVKHDGSCCLVTEKGTLCKRRDIRGGKQPPDGALRPDETPAQKGDSICWLPVPASGPVVSDDVFHRSALSIRDGVTVAHSLDSAGEPVEVPLSAGCSYELVGPSMQGNPHALLEQPVTVEVVNAKGKVSNRKAARHYLLQHGMAEVSDWSMEAFVDAPLEYSAQYITTHELEGVVFYCDNGDVWKINRGHIGAPQKPGAQECFKLYA